MAEQKIQYSEKTTAIEAAAGLELKGKVALITGSNSGLGKETTRVLALKGAKVYMLCRNTEKANKAREEIIAAIKNENKDFDEKMIVVMALDLSSLKSVQECAAKFTALKEPINYLINNAGIMALPEYKESADGFELQFAANHLGHFYLAVLLTPILVKSAPCRVISLSSRGHTFSPSIKDFENNWITEGIKNKGLPGKDSYKDYGWTEYGRSKSCNILFAAELNRRYAKDGVVSVSLHPGDIHGTGLARSLDFKNIPNFVMNSGAVVQKSIEAGAATTVRCVALKEDEIKGGAYYVDCNEAKEQLREDHRPVEVKDEKVLPQYKLWELSELLITSKGFKL